MQHTKKKIAVLSLVALITVLAGFASAQYTQTPQPQMQKDDSVHINQSSNLSLNRTTNHTINQTMNRSMNRTTNQTMNDSMNRTMNISSNMSVTRFSAMNLSENELNESMMKEFFSHNTNRMVNLTTKQFANVSQCFLFKNHIVIITVINHSINLIMAQNLGEHELNETMMKEVLSMNVNRMCNQTMKPLENISQCFRFKNHTIVINVIKQSERNISCKPELKIDEPKEGVNISTTNVTVTANYTNFSIIPHFGERNVKGQGYLHYFRDVKAPTTQGQPATTTNGTWAQSADFMYNWTNLTPGRHNFSVELVHNDHTPLNPPVVATVNVTIANNATAQTTAKNITTNTTNQTSNKTSNQTGGATTIALSAQNIKFNRSSISVPAGSQVTIKFKNMDNGIPHNFAVYQSSAATHSIFKGPMTTGPSNTTYTFTAPSKPGTYFYRCDVHPTVMFGSLIVT